ncbi:unnamed protein product [Mesocestoides corti]|uniref:GDP/GTP exchange factor Sec2 N-terminal domain-containing protein n=1 Tax=Mesocestoides corti TaxID=53468 RepID=A0A0R3U373_MESCO|nr:unnamed protein product [Mesocestoides corti]
MDGKGLSKALIEENVQLKLYIDELNKECLELQAALFEEANKMAQDAYAARHTAVKRAEELSKENGVLKNEVQALKRLLRLHQEESADAIAVCRSEVFSEVNGKSASSRRLSLLRSATTSLPPTGVSAGEMDKDRFLSTSTSIINVTSQEPVTRKYLLEALTSGVSCADSIGDKHYQSLINQH